MEWTTEKTTKLIEIYQSSEVLWDPTNEGYRNKNKRLDALCNISQIMQVPREEVERKIKNLVGQFSREMKKIKQKKKTHHNSADYGDAHHHSKWFAFKLLLFLKDKNKSGTLLNPTKVCEKSHKIYYD